VTGVDAPGPVPARPSRWRVSPPGVLFYLATATAIVIALDASSRGSLGTYLIAAPIWFVIAAAWLVRFGMAAARTRLRMPTAHWTRWLMIPVAMGLAFLVTRTDVLFDTRLALSRGAMDQMAADVMAGGSADRGWVGLYDVGEVERTANGLRFVIDDSGLYRLGFAYSPDGEPRLTQDNYSPLWTGATFEPVGGGWWLWSEAWD
jgi:hypothetical protein